jgi:hypothetical protein
MTMALSVEIRMTMALTMTVIMTMALIMTAGFIHQRAVKIPGHFQDIQGLISVKFQAIMKPYPYGHRCNTMPSQFFGLGA